MNLHSIFAEYSDMLRGFETARVSLAPEIFTTPGALENFLTEWQPVEGWASRQSQVQVLYGDIDTRNLDAGHIIAGEFIREDLSLHIRQTRGGWIATEAQEGIGTDVLTQRMVYVAEPRLAGAGTGMVYHRHWFLDDGHCPRQLFAAFRGFQQFAAGG